MRRLGVLGTMVWDTISGRDPMSPTVEEWGGIAYALSALSASRPEGWEIVPLVKVGQDLAGEADAFLRTISGLSRGARFAAVPEMNNRVTLRYQSLQRRTERLTGGVPPWSWDELGPMVSDLDAVYLNFISGFEMSLETAQMLRHAFPGLLYADLHSLFLSLEADGSRSLRPLPRALEWLACFDMVQLNEDEMRQITEDPLWLAAVAARHGTRLLVVTLGARGAVYVESPPGGRPTRTALVEAEPVAGGDTTGCGDVFGATLFCELLRDRPIEAGLRQANALAARNAGHRGATGLSRYLLGELARDR